jgi:hypothetical protein
MSCCADDDVLALLAELTVHMGAIFGILRTHCPVGYDASAESHKDTVSGTT